MSRIKPIKANEDFFQEEPRLIDSTLNDKTHFLSGYFAPKSVD